MNKEISEFLSFLRHEKNASPHTLAGYERDLRQVAAYLKEREVRWDKAGNVLLRGFLAELHEKKRKKSTIGRKLAALRSFYDFCVRKKWIAENPAKVLATPKQEKNVPSFLSEDETAALLDLPRTGKPLDLRDKAILELFYATGIRCQRARRHRDGGHPFRGTPGPGPGQGQEGADRPVRPEGPGEPSKNTSGRGRGSSTRTAPRRPSS